MTTGDRSVPTHTHSTTHGQMPGSRYSRRLHRGGMVAGSKAPGRACGRGGMGRRGRRTRRRLRLENAVTRIAGERASTRRQASATYIYIKDPGGSMGGPCGFRIPMTRPVCAWGAPKRRPSMHGANSRSVRQAFFVFGFCLAGYWICRSLPRNYCCLWADNLIG